MQIDPIDPDRSGLGNTESRPDPPSEEEERSNRSKRSNKKQSSPAAFWTFTLNNPDEKDPDFLLTIFEPLTHWIIFQEEKGKNGTIHLQGTLHLKKKERDSALKKINPRIHWEKTKTVKGSIAYCQKKETRHGKQWSKGIEIEEEIIVEEPYGWQLEVINILDKKPEKRIIHWFWEPKGNVGKTELCKYLVVNREALMLTGKSNDMYHALTKHKNRKIILVDIPRSSLNFINYGAIEQIKNGLVFSGKYESTQLVFNTPHVIVFANEPPTMEAMSQDRWDIHLIS